MKLKVCENKTECLLHAVIVAACLISQLGADFPIQVTLELIEFGKHKQLLCFSIFFTFEELFN